MAQGDTSQLTDVTGWLRGSRVLESESMWREQESVTHNMLIYKTNTKRKKSGKNKEYNINYILNVKQTLHKRTFLTNGLAKYLLVVLLPLHQVGRHFGTGCFPLCLTWYWWNIHVYPVDAFFHAGCLDCLLSQAGANKVQCHCVESKPKHCSQIQIIKCLEIVLE